MLAFLPPVIFIIFLLLFLWLLSQDKRRTIRICLCLFIISLFGGFILYTYGYFSSSDEDLSDVLFSTTFGIFNTFRMFFNEHDYEIAIQPEKKPFWHILFWACHLIAIMAANAVVLNLFGRKLIIDEFRMRCPHKEVYIIKGNDENALLLGNNIITHDGKPKASWKNDKYIYTNIITNNRDISNDRKRLVIFWLEEDDDEDKMYEEATRFGGITKVLNSEKDRMSFFKRVGLLKSKCSFFRKTKYKIIFMPNDISVSDDVYRTVRIVKEMCKNERKYLDIFVITPSEWERKKIETITEIKDSDTGERIYPYTFHLINEIDLITRNMIEILPPFACPGLNFINGVAARDFNVMILGFGVMGQAALLRLVMNGQFVESEMHAIVVDKKVEERRDYFRNRYPELEILCCKIDYQNFNVPGEGFFSFIDKKINIDYIVIAFNDDEINKQTALEIQFHYKRKGIPLPFIAVITASENSDSLREDGKDEKIFIFGGREEIYKESIVIDEKRDHIAKAVNESWNKINPNEAKPWEELDFFSQETNRATADFINAMLFLEKSGMNIVYNAKEFIDKMDEIKREVMKRDSLTVDKELKENLAKTEHLRWCAFHAATGWQRQSINIIERLRFIYDKNNEKKLYRKNTNAKLHIALAPWGELEKISEIYYQIAKEKKNFKEETYNIIVNIPKYLKEAGNGYGGKNVFTQTD
jgi:hypothetical protein